MSMQIAGAEVMVVSSAPGALAALPDFNPDVIVADLAMPGMDGFMLMDELRARGDANPPVLALSAYTAPADIERAHQAGFARHLSKPADYRDLVGSVAELVSESRQSRSARRAPVFRAVCQAALLRRPAERQLQSAACRTIVSTRAGSRGLPEPRRTTGICDVTGQVAISRPVSAASMSPSESSRRINQAHGTMP